MEQFLHKIQFKCKGYNFSLESISSHKYIELNINFRIIIQIFVTYLKRTKLYKIKMFFIIISLS